MIQMMQGHALTIQSGMPRDALFDAVITDPPYASGAATQNGISAKTSTKYTSSKNCPYPDFEGDAMDKRSWANLMLQVLLEAGRGLFPMPPPTNRGPRTRISR